MEQFGHVPLRLTNALNSWMLLTTIAMSDDVSGSWDQSQINPLFKTNILRGEPFLSVVGGWRYLPVKEMNLSGRGQFKKEPLIDNRNRYM